jgi:hypothetical protein
VTSGSLSWQLSPEPTPLTDKRFTYEDTLPHTQRLCRFLQPRQAGILGDRPSATLICMYSRRFATIDLVAGDYSLITLAEVNVYLLALYSLRFLPFTFSFSIKIGAVSSFCPYYHTIYVSTLFHVQSILNRQATKCVVFQG